MKIIGVILAGGKSTRMKKDKALLKMNGVSLLERQFRLLEDLLGKGNVFVSGDRSDFPHIKDFITARGPLGGLVSACKYFFCQECSSRLLVVPVDMPFLTASGLSRLIQARDCEAIGKFEDRQLPIIVRDVKAVLDAGEHLLLARSSFGGMHQGSLYSLFLNVSVGEIAQEPEIFFANMNTPEDWNAAIS